MQFLAPLTDEEKRLGRRRPTGILQHGDSVPFDVMLCDSKAPASAPSLADSSPRDLYVDRITGAPPGSAAQTRAAIRVLADARYTAPSFVSSAQAARDEARTSYVENLSAPSQQSHGSTLSRARYGQGEA